MALDGVILHQINQQLKSMLPAKINKIQQLSDCEFLFTLRSNHQNRRLLISAHSVYNRINLTQLSYTTLEIPNNFLMVLRKHIDGGIILSCEQEGLDRILKMQVETHNELGDRRSITLMIELMGKYANLILVDEDGKIIDALKRIPPFENSKRLILPQASFVPVEKQKEKSDPFQATQIDVQRSLVKQFSGFSPLLASEVEYRMQNKQDFGSILSEIKKSDQLYFTDIEEQTFFHVIPLTHLQKPAYAYPIMKGLDLLYHDQEEKVRIKQQAGDLFRLVKKELHKNRQKLPKLEETRKEALDCDQYRIYGDLLFSYQHQIRRVDQVQLPSFETGEPIRIPLDPKLDAKGNANKYYQKYHKHKRAQSIVEEQIALCEKEIRYFERIELQLSQATIEDAEEIRSELAALGYLPQKKQQIRRRKKASVPHFDTYVCEDGTIYVGKNNLQNEYLTWTLAHKEDYWLHAKDLHGAHVVIKCETLSESLLRSAALLAAWYSKGRYSSSVPINYTKIRTLKRIKGAKNGLVALSSYQTIYIDPSKEAIQALNDAYLKQTH